MDIDRDGDVKTADYTIANTEGQHLALAKGLISDPGVDNQIGWDGYVYPMAFSIHDFQPITGTIHMPPPTHQTFHGHNFVICSFCPRALDTHPEAVVVPYYHSNVDSAEVMYYVNTKYKARKDIEEGSITVHPLGIPHGPQPGTVEQAIGATRTEELVVMLDTFHPLWMTEDAVKIEDPTYWESWKTH